MEEWQQAMIRTEEHTRDIKDSIKTAATKEDLDAQTQYMLVELKPKNGLKDKLLWVAFLVICSLAGGSSVVALYLKANGG